MNRLGYLLTACIACSVVACGDDAEEPVTISLFQAAPDAIELGQSTKLLFVVTPPDAQVAIDGMGDFTGQIQAMVSPTTTTTYHLTATKGKSTADGTVTVMVGPQSAVALKLEPASPSSTAGQPLDVTLTALTIAGKLALGFHGTVHLSSTDGQAVLPADVVFAASDGGSKHVMVTLKTAGLSTLTGTDTTNPGTQGSASVTVSPAAAATCIASQAPAAAVAGSAIGVAVALHDPFGNVATSYAGTIALTATDVRASLPAPVTYSPVTDAGIHAFSAALITAGSQILTAADTVNPNLHCNATVQVTPAATRLTLTMPSSTTAGLAVTVGLTLTDVFDNPISNFVGTVHLSSTDGQAVLPADVVFAASDGGSKSVTVTFKTAGMSTLTGTDTTNPGTQGSASAIVQPAAAATCVASQAPAAAVAGSVIGVTVVARDPFGNVATTYAGTIALTATDVRANLPAPVTYVPLTDAGLHAFSTALITTGSQILTAADTVDPNIHCDAAVLITPAATRFALTMPGSANAGFAVTVGLTVKDLFDNPIPNFAGTVTFTSSDAGTGAVTPAPITFTGSQGGVASTSATFVTLGTQILTASDGGSPAAAASVASTVHGLVYTAPPSGRVRLVANAAKSNAQVVQLDLVANERLEVSSFFGGGPGSFAAGMNLPLDTTRAADDTTLLIAGDALNTGPAATPIVPVAIGRLATDHVLYTAVSRKRVAGTIFTQETEVKAGQVFYSVRLKLQPAGTVGPVFDGAQPSPLFRAAVRDQYGDDFVSQGDFGIGKLEIR